MTDDDAKAIREAAEKATPGKWERWANHIFVPGPDGANICSASAPRASGEVKYTAPRLGKKGGVADAHANAAYIAAASPAAVLRLLAELDEANETARMYADALAAVKAEREALRAAHDTVLADLCARTEERDALRAAARSFCICDGECYETRHGMMHGPCEAMLGQAAAAIAAFLRAMDWNARLSIHDIAAAVERAAREGRG